MASVWACRRRVTDWTTGSVVAVDTAQGVVSETACGSCRDHQSRFPSAQRPYFALPSPFPVEIDALSVSSRSSEVVQVHCVSVALPGLP